ncbi:MAG: 50S ribosomal protein L11 methyltransferase [Cohaesibacter sp.]|nr:50S ribosomal protein L11 methyltransferase [Cohaesibacter sp.]
MGSIKDKRHFILDHTALLPVPLTPEIALHLADDQTPLWRMGEEELAELGLPSPFWAFAWAGGQALARYCLDNPTNFQDKSLIDFASGSGLVAIAAAKVGANTILATDIDAFAIEAIQINAQKNHAHVETSIENILTDRAISALCKSPPDYFLAGDVFYDAEMTKAVLALLEPLAQQGTKILIGDPNRSYLPQDRLKLVKSYQVPVTRELEDFEIRSTKVWRFLG